MKPETITTIEDLCDFFDAAEPKELPRRVYKDTDCGAAISAHSDTGRVYVSGDKDWNDLRHLTGFSIGSIVEGSEVEFDRSFTVPVASAEVDAWLKELEELTSVAWEEANG